MMLVLGAVLLVTGALLVLVEAHVPERRKDVQLQLRVLMLSLRVGEAAADALPRCRDVSA